METEIKLTNADLNDNFFKSLKRLFKGRDDLEITISIKDKPGAAYLYKESREEYFNRLDKAIKQVENDNGISFTMKKFETFAKKLSAK